MENKLKEIETLLKKDKIEDALEIIMTIANDSYEYLAMSARTERINNAKRNYTINFDEWDLARNKILYAVFGRI